MHDMASETQGAGRKGKFKGVDGHEEWGAP